MKTILLVLIFLVVLTSSPVLADWSGFMGGRKHAMQPEQTPPVHTVINWKIKLSDEFIASPVITDNRLFIGGLDGIFYCINRSTGQSNWSFTTMGPIYSTACVLNDLVYFGSSDGNFYALRTSDGKLQFIYSAGESINSSPAVSLDQVVFSGSETGKVFSVSNRSGVLLWQHQLTQPSQSSPMMLDNKVIVSSNNGEVTILNPLDGTVLHTMDTNGSAGLHSPSSLDDQTILFAPGIMDPSLYAISTLTGTELWRYSGSITGVNPAPANPRIRLGSVYQQRLKNLDKLLQQNPQLSSNPSAYKTTSSKLLSPSGVNYFFAPVDPSLVYSSVGIASDANQIYFVTGYPEAWLVAVNRTTHTFVWNYLLGNFENFPGVYPAPVASSGFVYMADANEDLLVLSATDGTLVSSQTLGNTGIGVPAFADQQIIMALTDGSLVSIGVGADPNQIDVVAPTIRDLVPADGDILRIRKPSIGARLLDHQSGINSSAISFLVDGKRVPISINYVTGVIRYNPWANFSIGIHTVQLYVKDVQGNSSTRNWSFEITDNPDTVAPVLTVLEPTAGSTISHTRFPKIKISVVEPGDSGIGFENIYFSINGVPKGISYDPILGEMSYISHTAMDPGVYNIEARCMDYSQNQSTTLNWQFTLAPIADQLPPTLVTRYPKNGETVSDTRRPTIRIAIADDSLVTSQGVSLLLDNQIINATFDSDTNILEYKPTTGLSNGLHSLKLNLLDTLGNATSVAWNFNIDFTISISHQRVTDITDHGFALTFKTTPASHGYLEYSQNSDFSNSMISLDSRGSAEVRILHYIPITTLASGTTWYYRVLAEVDSDSPTVGPAKQLTLFTNSLPFVQQALVGGTQNTYTANEELLLHLTVERDREFSISLATLSDLQGNFTFSLSELRNQNGESFTLQPADRLRLYACSPDNTHSYQVKTILAVDSEITSSPIEFSKEVDYLYQLEIGYNLMVLVHNISTVTNSVELLQAHPQIKEMISWNSLTQSYMSTVRVFDSIIGDNYTLTTNSGYFLNSDTKSEMIHKGMLKPSCTSLPLTPGYTLTCLPGEAHLPDNPLLANNAKQYLIAHPAIVSLVGYDSIKQAFLSVFRINTQVLGDDFSLRADSSYFVQVSTPAILMPAVSMNIKEVVAINPPQQKSPNRASQKTSINNSSRLIAGQIFQQNQPLSNFSFSFTMVDAGIDSQPVKLKTNENGWFYYNLANLQSLISKGGNLSEQKLVFQINQQEFSRRLLGNSPHTIEEIHVEGND